MMVAKKDGGFGFKELRTFNSTMLANQATRLLSEPNALWTRVLKGLYFPNSDLLHAAKGGRASWAWPSLLVRREVLKLDVIWSVGNGRSIRVLADR